MSWRRATRPLISLWRTSPWPVQLQLRCRIFIFRHADLHSRTGLIRAFLPARLNVRVFSSPEVWQRYYLSTSVGQDGEEGKEHKWYDIDTPEFVQIVREHKGGEERLIIDVREPEELTESGQIPGTVNIPRKDFSFHVILFLSPTSYYLY